MDGTDRIFGKKAYVFGRLESRTSFLLRCPLSFSFSEPSLTLEDPEQGRGDD